MAFISGAARGQGRAHAVRLASEGARIIGIDVCEQVVPDYPGATLEDLHETQKLVEAAGQSMVAVQADVRHFEQVSDAVTRGLEEFGRLDIVVANAGIFTYGFLWEITAEQWQTMMDVNLTGVFNTAKATVPTLIQQGEGGSIVMVSSVAGLRGLPFLSHYSAAKHGVVGLCRSLANELGQYSIRVNSIHPGSVNTLMISNPGLFDMILSHGESLAPIFMNALPDVSMQPDDVATLVAFLASDDSKYMTGAQIPIEFGTLTR